MLGLILATAPSAAPDPGVARVRDRVSTEMADPDFFTLRCCEPELKTMLTEMGHLEEVDEEARRLAISIDEAPSEARLGAYEDARREVAARVVSVDAAVDEVHWRRAIAIAKIVGVIAAYLIVAVVVVIRLRRQRGGAFRLLGH
ncbi:MAG: hypothetical protein AAF721_07815 [Myxococcota bacterium]